MGVQTRRTLLLLPVFTLLLTLYPIGVAQGDGGTANLRVSLPAGTFINSSNPDPWLDEGWLLNLTGNSWSFNVRVTEISNAHTSYDTHLIVALNNASYENILDLTINGTTILKEAFQYGTPEPYNLGWIWPDDVYPTWFNDNVSLGTIDPFAYKEVNVSATFWDPTGARMHLDAYGKAVDEIQKVGDIIWSPNSEDSTVVSAPGILPHASFNWEPETPYVNNNVTFNATASDDPDGYIEWYYWNFGDGTPLVNTTNPVTIHNYTTAGTYSVTLTVGDNASLTDTDSQPITVVKHPVARFTYSSVRGDEPAHPHVGDNVTFDASDSTPNGGNIINYTWNFGDGTPVTTETDPITWNIYTTNGTFTVTLNVTDSTGLWDTETKNITIINHPVANFTVSPDPPYYAPVTLTFNASGSTPNGGIIISYAWDFGDGTTEIYVKDVNLTDIATHTYATNGTYTVVLNVTDSEGLSDTEPKNITIFPTVGQHPVANFTVLPLGPPYYAGVELTFNASLSTPDGGNITSYEWDFGDGVTEIYVGANLTDIATHTYTTNGTYTVMLTVTDSENLWNTTTTTLTVYKRDVAVYLPIVVTFPHNATEAYPSWPVNITVTVGNEGSVAETFWVAVYYNLTATEWVLIGNQTVTLTAGANDTLTFVWNTTDVPPSIVNGNYTIYTLNVTASTVPYEVYTDDNVQVGGAVWLKLFGDVNGDGVVDIGDVKKVKLAYSGIIIEPSADVNCDGVVDIGDVKKVKLAYSGIIP